MVGDRRQDVEAGRACNVQTVGVTWGFGSREELESAAADTVINRPDQLLRLIPDRP
jgi:phosphoglycolate phosphatase